MKGIREMEKKCYKYQIIQDVVLHVTDDLLDELMSEDWQSTFYEFRSKDDAKNWLVGVLSIYTKPERVDGLAHRSYDDCHLVEEATEVAEE